LLDNAIHQHTRSQIMKTLAKPMLCVRCELNELTASDLMTESPYSIRSTATTQEAIRFFTEKGISGAAVIGETGRAIGVLSCTDLLINQRERPAVNREKPTLVSDIMTPAVFNVRPDTPARQVAEQMIALNVHRLFVLDRSDVVVGVITALDLVRCLS
jgi:CBS domain-containing protein